MNRQTRILVTILLISSLGSARRLAAQEESAARPTFTLERCIQFAVQQNRELKDARLQLEISGQQVREAWGSVLPTIDYMMTYRRNLKTQEFFFPDISDSTRTRFIRIPAAGDNIWSSSLSLEQPLFQAQAFIGVGAASRFKALQLERVRGTAQQIVGNVRRQYYASLLASEQVRLTEASIHRVERTLSGARELEKAGLGNSYDVLRLEVELARLRPNLRRAQNERSEAIRRLKIAMGIPVTEPVSLAGSLNDIDLENTTNNSNENRGLIEVVGVRASGAEDLPRLAAVASRKRSDLREARLDTELARSQLSAERASVYPKVFAFANYNIDANEDGGLDFFGENSNQRTTAWWVGVRFEVPIFEGGARYSRMAQRSLQLTQKNTREELLGDEASNEIQSVLARYLEARERAASQKLAVAQARRGFEIASTEFSQGLGTQFNALDSEVALRETEFNYAEAVFEVLQTQAELDEAVGVVPLVDVVEEKP